MFWVLIHFELIFVTVVSTGPISFFYYFEISSYLRKSDQDLKKKKPDRLCVYENMAKEEHSFTLVELQTDAFVEINVVDRLKAKSRSTI